MQLVEKRFFSIVTVGFLGRLHVVIIWHFFFIAMLKHLHESKDLVDEQQI